MGEVEPEARKEVVGVTVLTRQTMDAAEIVHGLHDYGVTQTAVAGVVGVSPRAVRGWSRSVVRPDRYDRLAGLRDLVVLLSDSLTPRGVAQWLHARNRLLGDARPVDLLTQGRLDEVRQAAQAFIDGAYV